MQLLTTWSSPSVSLCFLQLKEIRSFREFVFVSSLDLLGHLNPLTPFTHRLVYWASAVCLPWVPGCGMGERGIIRLCPCPQECGFQILNEHVL